MSKANSAVENDNELVGSRRTQLVDARVVDGAHQTAERFFCHRLEHLVCLEEGGTLKAQQQHTRNTLVRKKKSTN